MSDIDIDFFEARQHAERVCGSGSILDANLGRAYIHVREKMMRMREAITEALDQPGKLDMETILMDALEEGVV